jgi:ribosomal protein L12E/L44/L45/RPP1/RPP2
MEDKFERFKKRQELKNQIENQKHLKNNADENLVNEFLNSEVDKELVASTNKQLDDKYNFSLTDVNVDNKEVAELLKSINQKYDKERLNLLVSDCKKTILDNIIKPFGIAKYVVAKYDKDGGNVTTIQNFEKGINATEEDEERYEEWTISNDYDRTPYEKITVIDNKGREKIKDFNSHKKSLIFNDLSKGEIIKDGYTDKELGQKENNNISKKNEIDLEHITSVKEIETDSKNHLFADGEKPEERLKYRVNISQNDNNLTLIEGGMNSSKNERDLMEWANSKVSKKHAKETGNPDMTNAEYYGANKELLEKEYKKSKDFIEKKQLKQQIEKQGKEIAITGAKEGVKMGLQQAVGIVLKELTESIFDEISDIYHHGFKGENKLGKTFFSVLKERLLKIGKRVLSKWKDVVKAFGEGFFSGFLSNLVTVVINMFVTTGKRVVRVIREGFFSLLKALKLLFFPPENMTFKEAANEASKLIVAGLAITGGIFLEQYIDTLLKSIPFADIISTVLVGIITGLATSLLVFLLDKLDLFGVNKDKRYDYVSKELDRMTENSFENIEEVLQSLEIQIIT